jgi:hypothetical protein
MAELTYLNFDLLIERAGERYRARVLESPAGQAALEFETPFSEMELENLFLRIGRPRRGMRRLESEEMNAARQLGTRLFDAVFSREVYACFRSSLDKASDQDKGLRLRVRLDAGELNTLPWELLYSESLNRFLAWSVETPIVRYLELPQAVPALPVHPPLKMLVMISNPSDWENLDVEQEWANLSSALQPLIEAGKLTVELAKMPTLSILQRCLRSSQYHILHFIGHGGFSEKKQDGGLVFMDEVGRGRLVSGQQLGGLIHDHKSLRLVVLNACEGARTSANDRYSGVAQGLLQQGIPAVIAMQFEITDAAASTFSEEFYSAILSGYPVDAALAEARKAIFASGNELEWGTPALFTRAQDGRLFELPEGAVGEPQKGFPQKAQAENRLEEAEVKAPPPAAEVQPQPAAQSPRQTGVSSDRLSSTPDSRVPLEAASPAAPPQERKITPSYMRVDSLISAEDRSLKSLVQTVFPLDALESQPPIRPATFSGVAQDSGLKAQVLPRLGWSFWWKWVLVTTVPPAILILIWLWLIGSL